MQLDTFIDVEKFTAEVEEGLDDITEAMRTQTARAAWYGICHAKAKRQKNKVELLVKAVNAKLTKKYRKELTDAANEEAEATGKKPVSVTVDMVAAHVALDADALKWAQVQLEADEIEGVCRVAMDAFRTRSSMIVSLGNLTRDQLKTNTVIQSARDAAGGYKQRRADRDSSRARRPGQEAEATE
ncbi:hypothetical protein [Sphingomonas sp. ACRSK]|uniref:hypothetical protein n=1 Tax=Sphingomonas sp. ACRSK TaxID=2918213 RepID=UPI001EF6AC53|nr:hypothetical protein [Sphingomonas sp. ACRSK]MCG7348907.1 hypothetical protein [Sphingomonas sp. ACRSK]